MWVLSDADTTIYLFGTFHALDGATDWFGRDDPRRLRCRPTSWCSKHWSRTIPPSFTACSPAIRSPLRRSSALRSSAAERRPFVVAAGQAVAAGRSAGMRSNSGADAVLRRDRGCRRQAGRRPRKLRFPAGDVRRLARRRPRLRPAQARPDGGMCCSTCSRRGGAATVAIFAGVLGAARGRSRRPPTRRCSPTATPLGVAGSPSGWSGRARCSSRSAPAI